MKFCSSRRRFRPSIVLAGVLLAPFLISGCTSTTPDAAPTSTETGQPIRILGSAQTAQYSVVVEPTIVGSNIVGSNTVDSNTVDSNTAEIVVIKPESIQSEPPAQPVEEDLAVIDLCEEIGNKLGSVSVQDCQDQQLQSDGGQSVLGRPLAMREFPELNSREPLGRVLLIGGIHGDEFSAVSIVFKWMEILGQHHSGLFHWRIVPVSNPDGLLAENSERQNNRGVDLNRNFPSKDWEDLALNFWRERTLSNVRRYPGPVSGSEPEVTWLVKQIKEFQPDVIISVHAPYHLVDYDGPPEAPEKLGDLQLKRLGVYPGSLGNYAGVDLNTPVVTIELPYAGILPDSEQISMMWTDLVAWLVREQSGES